MISKHAQSVANAKMYRPAHGWYRHAKYTRANNIMARAYIYLLLTFEKRNDRSNAKPTKLTQFRFDSRFR